MTEDFFEFKLGSAERKITAAVVIIILATLILPMGLCLYLYLDTGEPILLVVTLLILLTSIPLLFVPSYAPAGVEVTPGELRIVRRNRNRAPVVLPASQIKSMERIEPSVLRGCIRTFGCGGLLGSWGYFWCKKLGSFRGYITDAKSLVLIRTGSKGIFIISPDAPEAFIERATDVLGLPGSGGPE